MVSKQLIEEIGDCIKHYIEVNNVPGDYCTTTSTKAEMAFLKKTVRYFLYVHLQLRIKDIVLIEYRIFDKVHNFSAVSSSVNRAKKNTIAHEKHARVVFKDLLLRHSKTGIPELVQDGINKTDLLKLERTMYEIKSLIRNFNTSIIKIIDDYEEEILRSKGIR